MRIGYKADAGDVGHTALLRAESSPRARGHVAQDRLLPGEIGVLAQMAGAFESYAAGMAERGTESHGLTHGSVGNFGLYSAGWRVRRLPRQVAARRKIDMAAQRAFVGIDLVLVSVEVIGQEAFRGVRVDFSLVLVHELAPADMASVGAFAGIRQVEIRFFLRQLCVDREVGTYEVA